MDAGTHVSFDRVMPHQYMAVLEAENVSSLQKLPPELRGIIWRFVLLEPGEIKLTAKTAIPPAILSVCRQIRQEAIDIYYVENRFEMEIKDMDAQAVIPTYHTWYKYCSPSKDIKASLPRTRLTGSINWSNFVGWGRAMYSGHLLGTTLVSAHFNPINGDVAIMLNAVTSAREKQANWDAVLVMLEAFRKLLAIRDPSWAT